MSVTLSQTKTALSPGLTASFLGIGTDTPFAYSVLPGGAGGSVDSVTGIYTAPLVVSSNPKLIYDTIRVTDNLGATADGRILVGTPLLLFCEIIQREMELAPGRVYLWDQKKFEPDDFDLYVIVTVSSEKVFGNTIRPGENGWDEPVQSLNTMATLNLDILSRGPAARDRKEELVLAFNSIYSQSQQEGNSFYIAKLPAGGKFNDLSFVDGAAIPYRYRISINLQFTVTKTKAVPYFNTFEDVQVTPDS